MKRNKKLGKKMRESQLMCCNNKLKKDYDFMNHFQLEEFFTEEYKIIDKECRKNLEQISKSLVEINIAKGDN